MNCSSAIADAAERAAHHRADALAIFGGEVRAPASSIASRARRDGELAEAIEPLDALAPR